MGPEELSEYCRRVEDHLTQVNGGHLVRIVGAGFELVREWAETGVPLSAVCRGIDLKAGRHRLGSAKRPLRIEFCAGDVQDVYEQWRRAVGVPAAVSERPEAESAAEPSKRPSLSKHLDRAIDRLGLVAGRLDLPDVFLARVGDVLETLTRLRDDAKRARGDARDQLASALPPLDETLIDAARAATPAEGLRSLTDEATKDLAPFRPRLDAAAWDRAIRVTVDRLLRDRLGLPTIAP